MRILIPIALFAAALCADTLVLDSGLRVHGKVSEADGSVTVASEGKEFRFDRKRVREIIRETSAAEEFATRGESLGAEDAQGWYRLGLWAREKGLERAKSAFEKVIAIEPDHRAARRELGYERVGDEWLARDEAMKRKGFVLAAGNWVLPAEADRLLDAGMKSDLPATAEQVKRAEEIVAALCDSDAQVSAAAAQMLGEVPGSALMRPMRKALYATDPETRILAVRTLGNIGDRTALPWLIRQSLYDSSDKVRAHALRSVQGFGDPDIFYPYARELFAQSPSMRVHAAGALAELGDPRAVGVILHRISMGLGASPRCNIFVGKQQSFIRDFDVEIAQAAAIGDPIIGTIRDGIILDYKVLGGGGEAYVIEEEKAYASALSSLVGRDYGQDWKAYARYAEEQGLPKADVK